MIAAPLLRRRPLSAIGAWPHDTLPLLKRLYAARGLASAEEAELKLARMLAPQQLGGIAVAVDLLHAALRRNAHIVVVGDFDCDGATGTAVAVRGLRMLGATRVSYRVPHRIAHGYGLSPALVEEELAPIAPDLVLTVDSGIACLPGVAAAKARGWQVLITDHHLPGEVLPEADAIVNPNLQGDGFPSKALAGVGVVFYLLLALRARLRERGEPGAEVDLAVLLDLVAVGTVADLVPLDYNNRLLVAAGLKRLRAGRRRRDASGPDPALRRPCDGGGLEPRGGALRHLPPGLRGCGHAPPDRRIARGRAVERRRARTPGIESPNRRGPAPRRPVGAGLAAGLNASA